MRMRKKGIVPVSFLMFLLMVFPFATAQEKTAPPKEWSAPTSAEKPVDLGVVEIYAHNCACELQGVDALYFNKIQVEVSAVMKIAVNDSDVIGVLRVSYFDLMSGRNESREVMLQAYLFRRDGPALIDVVGSALLIKKSVGVTAEVKVAGVATRDPNPVNNKKTVNVCKVRLL